MKKIEFQRHIENDEQLKKEKNIKEITSNSKFEINMEKNGRLKISKWNIRLIFPLFHIPFNFHLIFAKYLCY